MASTIDIREVLAAFERGESLDRWVKRSGMARDEILVALALERASRYRRERQRQHHARGPQPASDAPDDWVSYLPDSPPRMPAEHERVLRAAVLDRAVIDAKLGDRDAIRWIMGSGKSERTYSCQDICDALDIDILDVRRAVARVLGASMRWTSASAARRREKRGSK